MLLGAHAVAWATTLGKNTQEGKIGPYPARDHASKMPNNSPPLQEIPSVTPDTKGPNPAPLQNPTRLMPTATTEKDTLVHLDTRSVKRHIMQKPYVPWVQTIGMSIDYGRLAMNLFTKEARRYAGSLSTLFRKNIQLSCTLGHQNLAQDRSMGNKSGYTTAGYYGTIGLDYFVFYNPRNNLYAGLCYGRSSFKNSTKPASPAEQAINKTLTASWWALIIGSEHQLFSRFGLYAGFVVHLKGLSRFEAFEPATNYVIPGYGRSVQNVAPSLTLYIKYQISFLKKSTRNSP